MRALTRTGLISIKLTLFSGVRSRLLFGKCRNNGAMFLYDKGTGFPTDKITHETAF